jgi:hypothetical protein
MLLRPRIRGGDAGAREVMDVAGGCDAAALAVADVADVEGSAGCALFGGDAGGGFGRGLVEKQHAAVFEGSGEGLLESCSFTARSRDRSGFRRS